MANLKSLKVESENLEKEIKYWRSVLDNAPEGHLIARATKNGMYRYSYYEGRKKESREIMIPKENMSFAEQLAMKEYAACRIKDIEKNKEILDEYINNLKRERAAEQYLKLHPGPAELIIPKLRYKNKYIEEWQKADYAHSEKNKDKLKYPTLIKGLLVRSKAESDWISRLIHYGIPFRYEELVLIDNIALHPDLTCLNVRTLKKFYIEHQGAWDKDDYICKLGDRERTLSRAGIIPWKNLIITTETADEPLDINWIDELIKYFLL